MNPTFSDREESILRFLEAEYLEKGERPQTMHDPGTKHVDVKTKFGLASTEYKKIITRFQHLAIVDFNPHAIDAPNGLLHIKGYVVEVVRQLDEAAARRRAESRLQPEPAAQALPTSQPRNLVKEWTDYLFSKWWFAVLALLFLVLGLAVMFIDRLKAVLTWIGVKVG